MDWESPSSFLYVKPSPFLHRSSLCKVIICCHKHPLTHSLGCTERRVNRDILMPRGQEKTTGKAVSARVGTWRLLEPQLHELGDGFCFYLWDLCPKSSVHACRNRQLASHRRVPPLPGLRSPSPQESSAAKPYRSESGLSHSGPWLHGANMAVTYMWAPVTQDRIDRYLFS